MADKAYPDWVAKQRLVQGVASASIQLVLMRENPKTVEEALQHAQRQLTVEMAQRWLHQRPPEQHSHSLELQTEETIKANTLHRSEAIPGSMQLEDLSRQVQRFSTELAQLQTDSERHQTAHESSKP